MLPDVKRQDAVRVLLTQHEAQLIGWAFYLLFLERYYAAW